MFSTMKGQIAVCVLAFVQVALTDKVVNISTTVDKFLSDFNRKMMETVGLIPLSPFGNGEFELSEGVSIGDNSYYRVGDAILTVKEDQTSATVHFHAGRRLFQVAFGRISYRGDDFTGLFNLMGSDFHVSCTVLNPGTDQCMVTDHHIKLEHIKKVISHTSIQKYNGIDITDFFERNILPMLNENLADGIPGFELVFQQFACNPELKVD